MTGGHIGSRVSAPLCHTLSVKAPHPPPLPACGERGGPANLRIGSGEEGEGQRLETAGGR